MITTARVRYQNQPRTNTGPVVVPGYRQS